MNTKKVLEDDWADTMQTLESLRSVIVKQRTKWRIMMAKQNRMFGPLNTDEKKFFDYIVKLYKESEALEHMINRIENGMNKSRCTITSGEESG
jgi:hypoxanthine phosphoribosyltransferase